MPGLSIEDLPAMSPAELRAAWRDQYRKPAPDIGPDLLRRGIAYRIQARIHGGLTPATKRAIAKAQKRLEQTGSVSSPRDLSIKPGTRLVREWQGKTYHVLVLDTGFEFDNRRYNSLSQIAREITGVHWSGPRFFGLKKRKAPPMRGRADG
ncbi:MAG: DUF2924 domain-containing protein [Parasphingopyxis sp.]|uniref:DUF2924 domain-containing protein n=1 Tax=Parasphingopyxis sp. TaxID=1920299 RepID=UPI0032EEA509